MNAHLFSSKLYEKLFSLKGNFNDFRPGEHIDLDAVMKYNQTDRRNAQLYFFVCRILKEKQGIYVYSYCYTKIYIHFLIEILSRVPLLYVIPLRTCLNAWHDLKN